MWLKIKTLFPARERVSKNKKSTFYLSPNWGWS